MLYSQKRQVLAVEDSEKNFVFSRLFNVSIRVAWKISTRNRSYQRISLKTEYASMKVGKPVVWIIRSKVCMISSSVAPASRALVMCVSRAIL